MKHNVTAIVTAITAAALAAGAATLEVPRLPEPATADREVSATHALPAAGPDGPRVFRLELVFEATPSTTSRSAWAAIPPGGRRARCGARPTSPSDGIAAGGSCRRAACAPITPSPPPRPTARSGSPPSSASPPQAPAAGLHRPRRRGRLRGNQPPLPEWLHPGNLGHPARHRARRERAAERITIMSAPDATDHHQMTGGFARTSRLQACFARVHGREWRASCPCSWAGTPMPRRLTRISLK